MTSSREKKKRRAYKDLEKVSAIGLYVGFPQSLLLQISLSLFLKTKFLFGKTNRVRFHEEFLTPYMKLDVRVPNLQILFVDYQMKNLSSFSPNFSQVESLTLPNQIYQWSPWLHQFKYYSPWLYHDELHQWNPWFYHYMESWLYQFKNWSLWLSLI